MDVYLGLCA